MEYFDEERTSLVIPDAHVLPNQDLSRFEKVGKLIVDRRPDRIVALGDFITLEALSNWDLNKSGNMEGKRYQADIDSGKAAIKLMLDPLKELQEKLKRNKEKSYKPRVVYLYGNHEVRLDRYLETKPELKGHLNLEEDLGLKEYFTDVIPYREYVYFDGVGFTHTPMNAANQPVAGKYAIHRAAEMTACSLVFAHSHRRESVNYYRHGANGLTQVYMAGAFFEHTEDYAYGGLNAYCRSLAILHHYATGRFDAEEISLERLMRLY